jgi:hypothetical protein
MENTSNCYCCLHAVREVQQMFSFLPPRILVDRRSWTANCHNYRPLYYTRI